MTSKYLKIEAVLKRAKHPMTCVEVFDKPEIRAVVDSASALSKT